ncbi:MAG TPA: carboxypeptidase regulatory-like domain-containing protein, partial [Chitinophagaceae bacterium]|nr:carboxypeptidase regulatory-like domain-containing protein [Chitinophagaceae bacterium]
MKKIFTLLLCCIGTALFAQEKIGKITGTVLDDKQSPLESATVTLLRNKDQALVKAGVTDRSGNFEFEKIAEGEYVLTVTAAGFTKQTSKPFTISAGNASVKLESFQLSPSAKSLGEVTVVARRPFIETKIDKTVVNVEASPTNAGATALEVLEKSPGIMVNNDGAISLRGKAGVIVMMDGKPTFLSPTDLANLLKNMPASAIDQIEIMTNPSSKYDASGNSGVINIKTKKGRAGGFNGTVMLGATISLFEQHGTMYVVPKSQNSFTFNYRKNKINLFGNYN